MKKLSTFIVLCLLSLTSLSSASEVTCDNIDIKGIDALLKAEAPANVIIGESHGYNEAAEVTMAALCQSLENNFKTSLGLELSYSMNSKLQDYFHSDGARSDKVKFLSNPIWSNPLDDGRHTIAILNLIEFSRKMRQAGKDISIYTFQASNTDLTKAADGISFNELYEKTLYNNIVENLSQNKYQKNIILVGNMHAKIGTASFGGLEFKTMASYFKEKNIITLNYKELPEKDGTIEIYTEPQNGYNGTYFIDVLTDSSLPNSDWLN